MPSIPMSRTLPATAPSAVVGLAGAGCGAMNGSVTATIEASDE